MKLSKFYGDIVVFHLFSVYFVDIKILNSLIGTYYTI